MYVKRVFPDARYQEAIIAAATDFERRLQEAHQKYAAWLDRPAGRHKHSQDNPGGNHMLDLSKTIAPRSDQLNADDLIGGPRTITITGVKLVAEDQPVAISFDNDEGKPWKPCKSMRRVLVKAGAQTARSTPDAA
jgi:hypothetical protein